MTTKDKLDLNSIDVSKLKQLTKEDCKEGVRVFWEGCFARDTGVISKSKNGRLVTEDGRFVYVKWDSNYSVLHVYIDDCYILEEEDVHFEQKYSIKEVAKILGLELACVERDFDEYNNNLSNKIKELEELGYTITKK